MINQVVAHDELMKFTLDMAGKVCRRSRFAVARAKGVMNASTDRALSDACAMETDAFTACFEAGDQKEGMQTFLEGV